MPNFTEQEKKRIKLKVEEQLASDERRLKIKEDVNSMFEAIADYADKNWDKFTKDPQSVFKAFSAKFIKGYGKEYNSALEYAINYIEAVYNA